MNTLRPISERRAAKVRKAGGRMKGTFHVKEITAEEYRKLIEKRGKEMRDAINGKPPKGKTDRQKAAAAADKYFSEFIRLRDSNAEGRVTCVTCSHTDHWRGLQCGHYVTRGHQATRYDEQNSSAQCRGCNYNGGKHLTHATAIDRKHGEGTAVKLEEKGRMRCSRTTSDFLFIADTYRKRVEWIAEHDPQKFNRPNA